MSGRRRQGILLIFLSLALSAFLVGHSLIVDVDAHACFESYSASINGERPFLRVSEMSFAQLASSARQAITADAIIFAVLGLLPLAPFLLAWRFSRDRSGRFWIACAIAALVAIVFSISTTELTSYYDCDLNGVSLGILIAPVMYMVMTTAAVVALALLQFIFRLVMDRE
jgi:4-amino-4-deoxy-L-arabinose transferase-like glycosyltransferase